MAYTEKDWRRRISERTDMSTSLIHLTRETETESTIDILYKILKDKKIKGSTTTSGFICGEERAVCFQDTPLNSLCQNVFFEQKKMELDKNYKLRYRAVGILIDKKLGFEKGIRPVIYEKTSIAKAFLPESEWWRIVNLNLDHSENIIDWTHEREWRVKGDFEFELSDVTILSVTHAVTQELANKFKEDGIDLIEETKGIITLAPLLF